MRIRLIIILLTICVITSCNNKKENEEVSHRYSAKNIIPKDKFIEILVDIELAENAIKFNKRYGIETKSYSEESYQLIMEKHKITKKKFDYSLLYYNEDIKEFSKIYNEVTNRLSQKLGEAQAVNSENTIDSLDSIDDEQIDSHID